MRPLSVRAPASGSQDAWLIGLDGEPFRCAVNCDYGLWISQADRRIRPATSGSPILNGDGAAISCLTRYPGPNPVLSEALPNWALE